MPVVYILLGVVLGYVFNRPITGAVRKASQLIAARKRKKDNSYWDED
ncbi:MAG: hypothetical protein JW874_12815 [Spirochaetales bacterium]|nr:hypothetical protein [Spirochaetales bacterium]